MICAGSVIVATASGFREGIVCVVNLLKFTGSFRTFGGVRGDSIGVGF